MSEEDGKEPPNWARVFLFAVWVIEHGGWPAIFIAALMSGFASKLLDLLLKLLEVGPGHFWSFVILILGSLALGGLIRRQTATVKRQNKHIEDLIVVNERLLERRDDEAPHA